jgi:RecB family exonuclease
MHDRIRDHFAGLIAALPSTTLTDDRQLFVVKAIDKLPPLYAAYRETNASRCGDQITLIVQSVLKELQTCPQGRGLDAEFRDGLHKLHEELGVPKLPLKAPVLAKTARRSK